MRSRRQSGRCGSTLSRRAARPTGSCAWGFDTRARLLETVVLVFDGGEELVIQAMPARKRYLDLLP